MPATVNDRNCDMPRSVPRGLPPQRAAPQTAREHYSRVPSVHRGQVPSSGSGTIETSSAIWLPIRRNVVHARRDKMGVRLTEWGSRLKLSEYRRLDATSLAGLVRRGDVTPGELLD